MLYLVKQGVSSEAVQG